MPSVPRDPPAPNRHDSLSADSARAPGRARPATLTAHAATLTTRVATVVARAATLATRAATEVARLVTPLTRAATEVAPPAMLATRAATLTISRATPDLSRSKPIHNRSLPAADPETHAGDMAGTTREPGLRRPRFRADGPHGRSNGLREGRVAPRTHTFGAVSLNHRELGGAPLV